MFFFKKFKHKYVFVSFELSVPVSDALYASVVVLVPDSDVVVVLVPVSDVVVVLDLLSDVVVVLVLVVLK